VLLTATVGAYLLAAGDDATWLLPRLAVLAVVGGPVMGAAGAAWRGEPRSQLIGSTVLGTIFVLEGILLQLGDRSDIERLAFGAEVIFGGVVALLVVRRST
jgi:hypothetical protein